LFGIYQGPVKDAKQTNIYGNLNDSQGENPGIGNSTRRPGSRKSPFFHDFITFFSDIGSIPVLGYPCHDDPVVYFGWSR
jgi:hypothetical protein